MLEKYGRLILAIIIGVMGPWLITFIFLITLGYLPALAEAEGNPLTSFTMIIFYSFNLTYRIPFLGNGYWLCFISWAVAGTFIGLITRNLKKSVIAAGLGILINLILYLLLVFSITLPMELIDPMINASLYSNFSWQTPFVVLFQIAFTSFVIPVLFFFTIIGGFLRDRLTPLFLDQSDTELSG